MNCENAMAELLETNIISSQNMEFLKRESENYFICDPTIVMNLRHQRVKRIFREKTQVPTKYEVISEAKRLVLKEEFELLAQQNGLEAVDREINRFKKQLEENKKMFQMQMNGMLQHLGPPTRSFKPLEVPTSYNPGNKIESQCCSEESGLLMDGDSKLEMIVCLKDKSNLVEEELGLMETELTYSTSDNVINYNSDISVYNKDYCEKIDQPQFMCRTIASITNNVTNCKVNTVAFNNENNEKFEETYSRESNISMNITKQNLINVAMKKWITYVHQQKINKTKVDREVNDTSQNTTEMLLKYWNHWKKFMKVNKCGRVTVKEKEIREEKMDTFVKMLQQKKHTIHESTRLNRDSNDVQCNTENASFDSSSLSLSQVGKHKSMLVCRRFTNQLPIVAKNHSSSLYHRFEAQQHIIANQKAKLQDQIKLIEELKLANIKKETELSTKEASEQLNEVLSSCNSKLKRHTMLTAPGKEKFELSSMAPSHLFLKMAEQAKEREKRRQDLKRKKDNQEEERLRKQQEEDKERKRQEQHDKQRKLEEVKEKKRLQQEVEIRKKERMQKMQCLMHKAIEHYQRNLLKKYGVEPLKMLVILRQEKMHSAREYANRRLLQKHVNVWHENVAIYVKQRANIAAASYNVHLLKNSFKGFVMVHYEYKTKYQVACDYSELRLQQHTFLQWQTQCIERNILFQKAVNFNNRKLSRKILLNWKCLPTLMNLEREKERRKSVWRHKVQEMLPDFKPVLEEVGFLHFYSGRVEVRVNPIRLLWWRPQCNELSRDSETAISYKW